MRIKKNFLIYFFLVFIFLLYLKIDFRLIENITCCGDDFDYYTHAKTIAVDGDFDYSNNIEDDPYFYKFENTIAPKGFVGAGILSAPFLLLGNILNDNISNNSLLNYEILFYSLSSVFYFALSYIFLKTSFNLLKLKIGKFVILLLLFGSGLPYFAFERYSMTHTYEVFINSLLFYLTIKFIKEDDKRKLNIIILLLSISVCLGILIRWTNYYLLLLPFLYKLLINEVVPTSKKFRHYISCYISPVVSILIFCYLSISIYGRLIIDPRKIYGESKSVSDMVGLEQNIFSLLKDYTFDILNILFGNEFGLFWISPIIFLFVPFIFIFMFKKKYIIAFILTFIFIQTFGIVIIWQTTASSYGYRYLFSIIPISIISFIVLNQKKDYDFIKYYVYPMSIFSSFSVLFFETNIGTQLSLTEVENSFGRITRYTQPDYVTGYLSSFLNFQSYQIIFLTSFLGLILFKVLLVFIDSTSLLNFLNSFGLPIENPDFIRFYENVQNVEYLKLIIVLVFLSTLCSFILKREIK